MMRTRPLIGISARSESSATLLSLPLHAVSQTYVRSVQEAGGLPLLIPPTLKPEEAEDLLARLDGLLLSGGGDVAAEWYSAAPSDLLELVDTERDQAELALVQAVLRSAKPLLAICRGLQVLNVATGGTLYADIASQVADALLHRPAKDQPWESSAHPVQLVPGSRLATILGAEQITTNSFHHQAAWRIGEGLVVTACTSDGVVEGLECPQHPFCVGVQWHPEIKMAVQGKMEELFQALVEACGIK